MPTLYLFSITSLIALVLFIAAEGWGYALGTDECQLSQQAYSDELIICDDIRYRRSIRFHKYGGGK